MSRYWKQANTFKVFATAKNYATKASYHFAHCIAKCGKPFTDGEYIKEAFLSSSDALFDGLPDKETIKSRIKDIPMSTRSVERRIEDMAEKHFEEQGIDISKIFAVTTDGAPVMVGKQRGAVTLIEKQVGHPIMKLHCIIFQKILHAKMSNTDLNEVMATVVKVVNFIVKRSALTHRQFQSLLEEKDCSYKDIPRHSAIRWLSCGKVLEQFVGCFDDIKAFLAEKGQDYPELEDEKRVVISRILLNT